MGMTFKRTDSFEKLFEEFAIDPDKIEKKEDISANKEVIIDSKDETITINNKKEPEKK